MLPRYALVYGQGGMVFDRAEHTLVANGDVRDLCLSRYLHRAWMEHPQRAIVRKDEIGFDPGGRDTKVTCNLWGGWPTQPSSEGNCDKLLELLRYMCSKDERSEQLYNWVLRWIAYPIKVPGAKMKTTLVVHGPQGTGKNLLFEVVMGIYGPYGRMIDQSAIEDRFNDWASKKLFLIADEVVARAELFHIKNKLKAFITGDWIRINPKNMAAYDERNHVNLVFLSNELLPVVLDEDDRRYAVIQTPPPLSAAFYEAVNAELRAGGAAAFHEHLLQIDLAGFDEHTKPPLNSAKMDLIEQSRDNISRFYYDLEEGNIPGFTAMPALSKHVYATYRIWCSSTGHRAAPMPKMISTFRRKHMVVATRERWKDRFGTVCGPHGFLMLGGLAKTECPPGRDRAAWLGECAEAFEKQIDAAAKQVAT
jgi:putative DNA primase/helicase